MTWNDMIAKQSHASFLQCWEWGEFQEGQGRKIERGAVGDQTVKAVYQMARMPLVGPLHYQTLSRGPISIDEQWSLKAVRDACEKARNWGALFLRIEPLQELPGNVLDYQVVRVKNVQPSVTLMLDLSHNENELLSRMHEKTRYNIGLSRRKGIVVEEMFKGDARYGQTLEDLYALLRETGSRGEFHLHQKSYYRSLCDRFVRASDKDLSGQSHLKLYTARLNGNLLAGSMVFWFGDTATYLHGGSANAQRNLMAPHLLQWTAVQEAKRGKLSFYDFWGISPEDSPTDSLAGVTRFKKGFGGTVVRYPGTYDIVLRRGSYRMYTAIRKLNRLIRN